MPHTIEPQPHATLDPSLLGLLIDEHKAVNEPRLRRLWDYYRNPARSGAAGEAGRLAQEAGLPARLTGSLEDGYTRAGREIVIENDIAWRINTIVSFMFGKPLARSSLGLGAIDVTQARDAAQ